MCMLRGEKEKRRERGGEMCSLELNEGERERERWGEMKEFDLTGMWGEMKEFDLTGMILSRM